MQKATKHITPRRQFLKHALGAGLTMSLGPWVRTGQAKPKHTLRILQWQHFIPDYDQWFNTVYTKQWGEDHDTQVIVDNVPITDVATRALKDIDAQAGHDIVMFLSPPCHLEKHLADLSDAHTEIQRRHGKILAIGEKSSFNPVTQKRYCITDSYVPDPINYRKDLWDDVSVTPDSWENIRAGAQKIKQTHNVPIGIGLSQDLDSNMCLRTIMAAFGAYEQDEDGQPTLKSDNTRQALAFVKALYEESMNAKVLNWDPSTNNRVMLAGRCSLTLNAPSITRTGEQYNIPIAEKIHLGIAPKGPENQLALIHLMSNYAVFNFSRNKTLAEQFLIDLVGHGQKMFEVSRFYNLPCYPDTVKNMTTLLQNDPVAKPADKYAVLADAAQWTIGLGYPGYANAVIDDSFRQWLIPNMFAQVATGATSIDDAMNTTHKKLVSLHKHWRQLKQL